MFRHYFAAQFHGRPEIELLIHDQLERKHLRDGQIDPGNDQAQKTDPVQNAGDKSGQEEIEEPARTETAEGRLDGGWFTLDFFQIVKPQPAPKRPTDERGHKGSDLRRSV